MCDIVVLGAGPYGLSAAAHLRTIKGLECRVFGEPMSFWSRNMPKGMFLRSNWTATQISCPTRSLTLEAFQADRQCSFQTPVPLDRFVEYGLWYQQSAVPDLDTRRVEAVERGGKGFIVSLQDGERVETRRVVIAGGIGSFARRPVQFAAIPQAVVSHTVDHPDFAAFVGKRVLVLGSGQSALESGALLHEAGADVEIVGRAASIHWLQGWTSKTLHHRMGSSTSRLLYAPTDVGPAGLSQLLARPHLLRRLPRPIQDKLRRRAIRPAGSRWLVERLANVPIMLNRSVASVDMSGDQVRIRFSGGIERTVDHVFLGTGFQIDVAKYSFLTAQLLQDIVRVNGFPVLDEGMETSVPGLHMIGAPAAYSFGPLLQFVSGTHFASRSLLHRLAPSLGGARNGRG
jgi:FAD-dependent urate hydroxylase